MKPPRHSDRWAGAALLISLSCVAWAQPALAPVEKIQHAVDVVTRTQQAAERAQGHVEAAQQRVEAAQGRVEAAAHQLEAAQRGVERAAQQADAVQARAAAAAERIAGLPEPAARAVAAQDRGNHGADRAISAQDHGNQRSERAIAAQEQVGRGHDRAGQAGRANERAEIASNGRAGGDPPPQSHRPADAGRPADPGKPQHSKRKKDKTHPTNQSSHRSARAEERANGPKEEHPAAAAARNQALAEAQLQRFTQLLRVFPRNLEMTRLGVAVRGEVVGVELSAAAVAAARKAGFVIVSQEMIEGLDLRFVTLRTPRGMSVDSALARLAKIAPGAEFVANHIHIQSAAMAGPAAPWNAALAQGRVQGAAFLGIIDGGVARHPSLTAPVEQRGFVRGAPAANSHATAVASLAVGTGRFRGASPGAALLVADVYGRDPAGGNAMAVVRALGWMVTRKVPVVAMPLAGPPNAFVAKAILRARQRGLYVIAPVGNGGPASPASYPAAYPTVVAVTGVDRHNRILIEAGRGPRIDYAAPAADMVAANAAGGLNSVRGTSFAVPLVAGRLAVAARRSAQPIAVLDKEAADLGAPGPDRVYGRGLVCARCRNQ
jgi:minor extracellular protease Epr